MYAQCSPTLHNIYMEMIAACVKTELLVSMCLQFACLNGVSVLCRVLWALMDSHGQFPIRAAQNRGHRDWLLDAYTIGGVKSGADDTSRELTAWRA